MRENVNNKLKVQCEDVPTLAKEKQVFGTKEWATENANFISGCIHDCKYCYSKEMAIRFKRKTPKNWTEEELNTKKLNKKFKKIDGYIMFPSSHDISPENLNHSIAFLGNLLRAGNSVLIVTKPHMEVVKEICSRFSRHKGNLLFRFTIGSSNTETLKFWEPNAPSFEERLESLKHAFELGFKTSISCEPILDIYTKELLEELLPYVTDAIWIGKPNFLLKRLKMNGISDRESIRKANELNENLSDSWIFGIYQSYKDNPKIKWKESIKKIVNIEISTTKGLDK
jgi:DNA repair photolyase